DGVAVPPRLRLALRRQWPAVGIDVPQSVVGFVLDQRELWRLDNLSRLRLEMELQESHRQAVGVGILLGVHRHTLFPELRGPRGIGKATRHVGAGFEERRDRRAVRIDRKALRRRFELNAAWPARPYTETARLRRGCG